jgi:hypothetical protein
MADDQNEGDGSDEPYDRDGRGRFVAGNRGGPGRPKGSTGPSLKAALLRALDNARREDGRGLEDVLIGRALKAASEGDFRFFKEIFDRLDGPIRQEQVVDTVVTVERVSRRQSDPDESDNSVSGPA